MENLNNRVNKQSQSGVLIIPKKWLVEEGTKI